MFECKPITLFLTNQFKLSSEQSPKIDEEFKRMNKIPYANTIVSIMYFMLCTRLVLAHT